MIQNGEFQSNNKKIKLLEGKPNNLYILTCTAENCWDKRPEFDLEKEELIKYIY